MKNEKLPKYNTRNYLTHIQRKKKEERKKKKERISIAILKEYT